MTKPVVAFRNSAQGPKKRAHTHTHTHCRHNVRMSKLMINKVYVPAGRDKHSSSFRRPFNFSHATKHISLSPTVLSHRNICSSNTAFIWTTDDSTKFQFNNSHCSDKTWIKSAKWVRQEVRNYSVTYRQRLEITPTDWQNLYFKEHITFVRLSVITLQI
jgi:hypothetical protein